MIDDLHKKVLDTRQLRAERFTIRRQQDIQDELDECKGQLSITEYYIPHSLFYSLQYYFMNQQYGKNSQLYFHKVDKTASGSSYKARKLWEIHNFISATVSKICEISCERIVEWVWYTNVVYATFRADSNNLGTHVTLLD